MDTRRISSRRLYGKLLRSVASCGAGPGNRWTYFRNFGRSWFKPQDSYAHIDSPGNAQQMYQWSHLHYQDSDPRDIIYVSDVDDDVVPCSYQDRRALRGSHRAIRSPDFQQRRFSSWKEKEKALRQDYEEWKSNFKDSTLRTHGDQNPKPLICPTSAALCRIQSPKNFLRDLTSSVIPIHQFPPLCLRALTSKSLPGM